MCPEFDQYDGIITESVAQSFAVARVGCRDRRYARFLQTRRGLPQKTIAPASARGALRTRAELIFLLSSTYRSDFRTHFE